MLKRGFSRSSYYSRVKETLSFIRKDGEPWDGGPYSSGESDAGCFFCHRTKCQPGPPPDCCRGRSERRKELCAGELRGQVSGVRLSELRQIPIKLDD